MKNDFIEKEMEELGADGVDFVPVFYKEPFPPVYASYTREQWMSVECCPKTGRLYWKKSNNGGKVYLNWNPPVIPEGIRMKG